MCNLYLSRFRVDSENQKKIDRTQLTSCRIRLTSCRIRLTSCQIRFISTETRTKAHCTRRHTLSRYRFCPILHTRLAQDFAWPSCRARQRRTRFVKNSSIYALRFFFATIASPAESIISLRFAAELTSIFSIFFCSLKRRASSMRSTISAFLTTFCGSS